MSGRSGPDFQECETCAAKSGTPTLCAPCIHNRRTITRLKEWPCEPWSVVIEDSTLESGSNGFRAAMGLPRAFWHMPGVLGAASARGGWIFGTGITPTAAVADLERALGAALIRGHATIPIVGGEGGKS